MKYAFGMGALALLCLASCGQGTDKDYDSAAACSNQGLHAGTDEYEKCMREENAEQALNNQREEYEEMKRQQDYYRNQRATY